MCIDLGGQYINFTIKKASIRADIKYDDTVDRLKEDKGGSEDSIRYSRSTFPVEVFKAKRKEVVLVAKAMKEGCRSEQNEINSHPDLEKREYTVAKKL